MVGLADLSLVEAADAVRNGEATSMELLDACWANLDAANPKLNATIWLDRAGDIGEGAFDQFGHQQTAVINRTRHCRPSLRHGLEIGRAHV